jgi:O-antigen/teichoic acid export membrane protein
MRLHNITSLISNERRKAVANAIYGIADYLTFPIGMLLTAPFLLRHLGAGEYGVWILANAVVSSGGIVSGSSGDAIIKCAGMRREKHDFVGVQRIVRNMLSINLILSGFLAGALWCFAPYVAHHIVKVGSDLQVACLQSLRIGSALLLIKSVEGVFVSTLRAFETYKSTVCISICSRAVTIASAVIVTSSKGNVVWIMAITLFIPSLGLLAQSVALRSKIGNFLLLPSWHREIVAEITPFGMFSWLQAVSGILFSQADRFFIGFFLGVPAVAAYGLCVQVAQPIHGLISSGMHFLFPHLSVRYAIAPVSEIKYKTALAFKINLGLVIVLSLPLILFGKTLVNLWISTAFDQRVPSIFPIVICSFAFLGINVTAHYVLLATGSVRIITYLNAVAGMAMLFLMTVLIPRYGLYGAALARLIYGPVTCLAYIYVFKIVWQGKSTTLSTRSVIYELASQVQNDL